DLPAEGVPARADVEQAEVIAVEHDQAGAGAERGHAAANEVPERLRQPLPLDAEGHRGGLAAGDDERVEPVEVLGGAHDAGLRAEPLEHAGVRLEVALDGQDPYYQVRYQPRC